MRIGTTSYIIPADILPNVEHLAPIVDDIELVLFETDEYGSNLPGPGLCAMLNTLAEAHQLTYTVHMPLDLKLGDPISGLDVSLLKARRVLEATQALSPVAYVLHLDARELGPNPSPNALARWQAEKTRAVETLCQWMPEPHRLCLENLEAWPPEWMDPVLEALPISRTVDIGHHWVRNTDPLEDLERWSSRTKVVHLHAVDRRDHASLDYADPGQLDRVIDYLVTHFTGVLTLEVFSEPDLTKSLAALRSSMERVAAKRTDSGAR